MMWIGGKGASSGCCLIICPAGIISEKRSLGMINLRVNSVSLKNSRFKQIDIEV